ncbi:MAG TPA: polysaccharide deacetylase family protein [Terriglobales bacterium]|nr:polysaccharide deacetylase family protein [Terriglobales bacterium]
MRPQQLLHKIPNRLWHGVDRCLGPGRGAWPYCVVAFHRIGDYGDELAYPAGGFAELCRYWRDHYEIISLDQLLARLAHGDGASAPTLSITFDDGYRDNHDVAAPILDRLELSATFFITAGAIGTERRFDWDAGLAQRPALMHWDEVRALHAAGFGIGSHTLSHARVSTVHGSELDRELTGSRRLIEAELHQPVEDFAYPYGLPGDCGIEARQAARDAGYRTCLSCHGGWIDAWSSPFELQRVCISPRYHARARDWARQYSRMLWRRRYPTTERTAA